MAADSAESDARAAVDMLRAHVPYATTRLVSEKVACSGTSDPITGHWCQFIGTPQEQYMHQIERVSAALTHVTPPGDGDT